MILARCNGTLLVETDRGVGLVEQGGGWLGTAIFVAALLALVSTAGGVLVVAEAGARGAPLLAVPVGAAAAAVALWRRKRRLRDAAGLPAPWLLFDLQARRLERPGRPPIALDSIQLERVFQVGSSAKALALRCPDRLVIARGTPFGDAVDALEHALRQRLALPG